MALDVGTLAAQMLEAALPILRKETQDADSFAKVEFTKIAQTIVAIGQQLAAGEINQDQAALLLDMQTGALPQRSAHAQRPRVAGRRGGYQRRAGRGQDGGQHGGGIRADCLIRPTTGIAARDAEPNSRYSPSLCATQP